MGTLKVAKTYPEIDPDQPIFLRVPFKCRELIIDALKAGGFKGEAKQVAEFTKDYATPRANAIREAWVKRAIAQRAKDGEIEFDSDATISHSDDPGEYVLGWVWIEEPEKEKE